MKIRVLYIIYSLSSLFLGTLFYILFSENTILENFLGSLGITLKTNFVLMIKCKVIRNYLCDFLWAFSLTYALWAIYMPVGKRQINICICSFTCGVLWEFLQHLSIVNGTGDLLDICMYLLAAATVLLLNFKRRKEK